VDYVRKTKNSDPDSSIGSFAFSSSDCCCKLDIDEYGAAMDISQAHPDKVLYIDDQAMLADIMSTPGIHDIRDNDFEST
jgi:hypothetical protein